MWGGQEFTVVINWNDWVALTSNWFGNPGPYGVHMLEKGYEAGGVLGFPQLVT